MSEERKVTWTKDQEKAIATHGCNLLVSAAAGSGKTAVLVERVIRMITDETHPVDIDRLLVVTFTNAAAGEMKERILAAVEKKLNEQPENGHLQRQLSYVNHADITTLHSFCLKVIRENFDRISVDPGFRIGEPGELELLRQDALTDVIEAAYENGSEEFYRFAESYAPEKSDEILNELVLQLYQAAMSRPNPEEWLASWRTPKQEHVEMPEVSKINPQLSTDRKTEEDSSDIEFLQTKKMALQSEKEMQTILHSLWMEKLLSHAARMLEDIRRRIQKAIQIAESPEGPASYLPALAGDRKFTEKLLACVSYEEYVSVFSCMDFVRLKAVSKKENVDSRKKDLVNAMRKEWKDQLTKLGNDFFSKELSAVAAEECLGQEPLAVLADLTAAFADEYREQKNRKNLLDFNDLEHLALAILCERGEDGSWIPSDVGCSMAAEIDEIMVDEYQDINLMQDLIIKSVSREADGAPNIFMVGDVKQSIYRFRLARPELFLQKYETYGASGAYRRVILGQNFRSRSAVLSDINFLFRQIMTRDLGGISYEDDQALYPGAAYPEVPAGQDNSTEICVIYEDEDGISEEEQTENLSTPEIEGLFIAQKIKSMMRDRFQIYDREEKRMRDLTPGDVVVLVRTMKGFGETLADTLMAEGVPAYCETTTGYFNTVEVRTVLHLLKALDNPRDDISLAAVLKSPIGNFFSEDLARIKSFGAKKSFYDCCVEILREGSEEVITGEAEGAAINCETSDAEITGEAEDARVFGETPGTVISFETSGNKNSENINRGRLSEIEERKRLQKDLAAFFARFDAWRRRAPLISLYQLIDEVLEESGYRYYVAAMPSGERRLKNIEMLMEKAAVYEESGYRGLFRFVRYIEKLREYEVDFGEAPAGDGGSGHVRVMSIHKSKGLEFPVVFVAGITKSFNFRDSSRTLLIHPDLGIGTDSFNLERRLIYRSLKKKVIGNQTTEERLAEELCVLYVAATRAKEKLLFVGFEKNEPQDRMEKYLYLADEENEKLPYAALRGARCFLDFLLMGLMRCSCMRHMYEKMDREPPASDFLYGEKTTLRFSEIRKSEIGRSVREDRQNLQEKRAVLREWNREIREAENEGHISEEPDPFLCHYPYAEATSMPAKYSVSDVKHRFMDTELPEEENARPFLNRTDNNPGTLRGTAYHKILELWDYSLPLPAEEDVRGRIHAFAAEGRIPAEYEDLVPAKTLVPFFCSELGRRMKRAAEAGKLMRESQFVMGLPAKEIGVSETSEESILIQGMVDACFEEDGSLILVDYKTDRLHTREAFLGRYKVQLDLYARALEAAYGKPVTQKIIYSFEMEEEILL
ncbi:MAG: UvrD-helicase domain-containing protein [Lachnospiraceae bacterium]|nr:UvrD-helicase domain-containing protein [Lachnospiraceae bacterium]